MKTASTAVVKWQSRATGASADYVEGARTTDKDQAARAIAAKAIYQQALTESFARDSFAKGLSKSGKQGWIKGVEEKGASNFATGTASDSARTKYVTESSKYDSARKAADPLPKGGKGSQQNINRAIAVMQALRAAKIGK